MIQQIRQEARKQAIQELLVEYKHNPNILRKLEEQQKG